MKCNGREQNAHFFKLFEIVRHCLGLLRWWCYNTCAGKDMLYEVRLKLLTSCSAYLYIYIRQSRVFSSVGVSLCKVCPAAVFVLLLCNISTMCALLWQRKYSLVNSASFTRVDFLVSCSLAVTCHPTTAWTRPIPTTYQRLKGQLWSSCCGQCVGDLDCMFWGVEGSARQI